MATITKGKTFVSGETVEPADMHQLVDAATVTFVTADDTDNSTLEVSSNKFRLKDAGTTAAKLAATLDLTGKTVTLPSGSVNAAALASNAVETAKINDAAVTAAKLSGAQSGAAPIYGCRAWVNFDGTRDSGGTVSTANTNRFIRSSGNVASVLRNGTGNYTVTLTTALPDADYAVTMGGRRADDVGANEASPQLSFSTATTSSFRVGSQNNDSNSYADATDVCVAVFR
jgi:hypothetical protein